MLSQARSTHRHRPVVPDDEPRLVARLIELATLYGRYGYRRITGLLRGEGWTVNHKRIERLWRREGLKVPQKQPKRGRLWLADGSCIRRRPEYRHHVWAYDFVADRTHDGRPLKILTIVEEYSRECLAIVVARWLRSIDVLDTLAELFVTHGVPAHIRSDNGPEFTAELIRLWLEALQVQTLFIEPGSPWENGYVESFNGKLRDELLDREIFYTLTEAQILIERWRREYNTVRPHSALGYRPPAPEAMSPAPLSPAPQGFLGHLIAREYSQEECRNGEARSRCGGGGGSPEGDRRCCRERPWGTVFGPAQARDGAASAARRGS